MLSSLRKDHKTSMILCHFYFMSQVVCVIQYMYLSIKAFGFSAFFTGSLYSISHTEAMQKRRQKQYIRLRMEKRADKCGFLDITWLLHTWKCSSFSYLHKIFTKANHAKFQLGGGQWSLGSTITEELLIVKSCWGKRLIHFWEC